MGGRSSGSGMGSGGNSRNMHEGGTGGRMIQVTPSEWQGSNANGYYAAVGKLPSNLMTLNKSQLRNVARGLGEPGRNVDSVGKRALVNTIKSHGSDVYSVSRSDSIRAGADWQPNLYTTNKNEALRYARAWLRSNRG